MRDERGIEAALKRGGRAGRGAVFALVFALSVHPAHAQSGFLQVQYQRSEAQSLLLRGDSTLVPITSIQSYWIQNYQLNQALSPNPNTHVTWQLGFQDRQAVDRLERTQTPYGNLRLAMPTFGVYASVRPVSTRTTTQMALFAGAPIESVTTEQSRVNTVQSVVSAYLSDPRLPRVDVSWIRDQRQTDGSALRRYDDRRDLRVSHNLGHVNLRASYGDLARGSETFKTQPYQRNLGAGAGVELRPREGMNLKLDYDLASFDRRAQRGLATDTRTHRVTTSGTWSPSRTLSWNLFSWYQRSQQPARARADQDNAEGQLFLAWQPSRATRFQAGGQARRVVLGTRAGNERILLGTVGFVGPVRPGWTATADLAQTVTWSTFRTPFGVSTAHVGSRARLREGIDLTADVQGAVNNDTIAISRAVGQGSMGLVLVPLRSFQSTLRGSFYRVGPGFDRANTTTRSGDLDVRWVPWQNLQFSGNLRRQVSGPSARTSSSTRTAYVRWNPGTMVLINLNYTSNRFDVPTANTLSSLRRDREIVSLQTTWSLDRSRQVTAEASVLDPHKSYEANAYNATFTWRFGR